jgi:protein-L-isoaspartate(D-aspartate) O-methyltransferase
MADTRGKTLSARAPAGRLYRSVRLPPDTVCPECGFDLAPGKPCGACGYDPLRDMSHDRRRPSLSRMPLLYIGGVAMLMAVLFVPLDLPHLPAVRKSAAAASARKPAAEPAPPAPAAAAPAGQPSARFTSAVVLTPNSGSTDITRRNLHPPLTDLAAYADWMRTHTDPGQEAYLPARWACAGAILSLGQIQNTRVLEAFLLTPREEFCRTPQRAYENAAMPIGYGQTISGPYLVARMTDALNPQPEQKVLEVGTGSGYQSAVLSELSNHVFSIEIVEDLARETDQIYRSLWDRFPEYHNVKRKIDDGYYGWAEYAPFDRIIVTCGIDHIPPELLRQLAPEGIMVIPVGPPSGQTILRIVKHVAADGSVTLEREDIYHGQNTIVFVPFTSKSGLHVEDR